MKLQQETGIMEFLARLFLHTNRDENEKAFENIINTTFKQYIQTTVKPKDLKEIFQNNPN